MFPAGRWYCEKCCPKTTGKEKVKVTANADLKSEYMRSLRWQGLVHQVRIDAERENSGPVMMMLWRHDFVPFWNKNHFKYQVLAHRLLASKQTIYILNLFVKFEKKVLKIFVAKFGRLLAYLFSVVLFFQGVNGWVSPMLAHDMVHNRTANVWGKAGHNIAQDLLVEHCNNDFKGK